MKHHFTLRIGGGENELWRCQDEECLDEGPFRELMARPCKQIKMPTEVDIEITLLKTILLLKKGNAVSVTEKDGSISIYNKNKS